MKMDQHYTYKHTMNYLQRFYVFLRDRDAKIVELFFLGLHLWILVVFILPEHTLESQILTFLYTVAPQVLYVIVQTIIACLNLAALMYDQKYVRIISSYLNVILMLAYSTGFALLLNPNTGTYALLGLLASFACWKIQIRQ